MNPFKLLKEILGLTEGASKEKELETKPQENTCLKNEGKDLENTSSFFSDEEDEDEELVAMAEADEEDEEEELVAMAEADEEDEFFI